MDFSNELILPANIPLVQNITYQPLEKAYLKVKRITFSIVAVVFLVGICVAFYFIKEIQTWWAGLITFGVFSLSATVYWILDDLSFRHSGYAIREHDLLFRSGWWIQKVRMVPFNRVQHLSIESGMMERQYGLASLCIYTAGAAQADFTVHGLQEVTAQQLKAWISTHIQHEDIIA